MPNTPLPTKAQAQQAYSYMVDRVHVPAFFEKLAANGVEPRNEAEAQQLLQLGAVLADAEAKGQYKQASEQGNQFLDHVLGKLQPKRPVNVDALVKQSADKLIADNELAKTAALVYAHAVAGGEIADDDAAA